MFNSINRPASPDVIRRTAQRYLSFRTPTSFNPGKAGALIGVLNKLCGSGRNRRLVLGFLFGVIGEELSSTQFSPQQWNAISHWVDQQLDPDGKWIPHPNVSLEISWIMDAMKDACMAAVNESQLSLFETEVEYDSEQMMDI